VNEHGAARFRNESGPWVVCDERSASHETSLRWETAEHECSSWNGFGVQKSIGRIAGRDARGRYQAHHGHARPSPKESHATRMTRRAAKNIGRQRCVGSSERLLTTETTGVTKPHAQASSDSIPERYGLGDSGSPRAASARRPIRWKGVRVVDALP
jgi:hypothetical protein